MLTTSSPKRIKCFLLITVSNITRHAKYAMRYIKPSDKESKTKDRFLFYLHHLASALSPASQSDLKDRNDQDLPLPTHHHREQH